MSDKWIPNPQPFPTRPPSQWPAPAPVVPGAAEPDEEPVTEPSGHDGRLGMILGVIGVALAAAIVTFLVLRVIRPPKPRVQPPVPTTAPASSTTTTTLPQGPAITAAELSRLVDQLVPFVEQERRLEFVTPPTVLLDDDVRYATALKEYLARSDGMLERLTTPFEVLGLNPNDADMIRSLQMFHGNRSAVFYDTVHNIVHVRAVPSTPYLSTILVVGLTEQLDDQHFTTDRIATPKAYGDGEFGMLALVGGDGWRIAAAWVATRSPAEQEQVRAELQARRGDDGDTSKIPSALAAWFRFPADHGVPFTTNLVTATSSAPLDAVFRAPPDGSAAVLDPARLAAKLGQLEVKTPTAEGKVVSSGTFGRFFLESMLSPVVSKDVLVLAMSGYRGDSLVAYEKSSGGSCIRLDVTTGDAATDNMHKTLSEWGAKRNGSVSLVADPDRAGRKLVRLDVCSDGGDSPDTTTSTTPGAASGSNPSSTIPAGPRP